MPYNEADLKKKIKRDLPVGSWVFSPVQTGYGQHGVPDIIVCKPVLITQEDVGKTFGLFVGIEAKMKGNKPTKLQEVQLRGIKAAGGKALVITGDKKRGSDYKTEEV